MNLKRLNAVVCAFAIIFGGITVHGVGINEQTVASDTQTAVTVSASHTALEHSVTYDGRYRVLMNVSVTSADGGVMVKAYKNKKAVWSQYVSPSSNGTLDVKMLAVKTDKLRVIIEADEGATPTVDYDYTLTTYDGVEPINKTVLDRGYNFTVKDSKKLSDYIKSPATYGTRLYATYEGFEYDLNYFAASDNWQVNVFKDILGGTSRNGWVFVSQKKATLGALGGSPKIDIPIKKDGILHISGAVPGIYEWTEEHDPWTGLSDDGKSYVAIGEAYTSKSYGGVCTNLYQNGKKLWSSRVGESSARWDDEFDISYFSEYIDVVLEVKAGDVLTFSFDKWRQAYHESSAKPFSADISDISIDYVEGDTMSTALQKVIDDGVVFDIYSKKVYHGGEVSDASIAFNNSKPALASTEANGFFGSVGGVTGFRRDGVYYQDLEGTIKAAGMQLMKLTDNIWIAYNGIERVISYSEASQLKLLALSDDPIVNTDGTAIDLSAVPEKLRLNVKLKSPAAAKTEAYIFLAGRKDGKLVYAKSVKYDIAKGDIAVGTETDIDNKIEYDTIEAYVWTTDLKPLAEPSVINAK